MNSILVIGVTGNAATNIGRQVIAQLPTEDVLVRAMARNPETADLPPHVEVVRGDLTDISDPRARHRRRRGTGLDG